MSTSTRKESAARSRLVAVATDLFYRKGIPNVGINEIVEASTVARMTLYNHFPSKDALVMAVLEQRTEKRQAGIAAALARARTPRSKVLAVFDYLAAVVSEPDFRGCAFINAAVERAEPSDPAHRVAAEHKSWIAARFEIIARSANWSDPGLLAEQLLVLWDGAAVGAYLHQSPRPVVAARAAVKSLLSNVSTSG
ncbi:MAG: TetR/AcrR family transcriptional regulator [Burkholderiaceae bacterium]